MVVPERRIESAISFGVFCRAAPSTSAIMRSRKVWPGSEVMRTVSSSESTLVPPVTALRSPPLSRMTGADSPVMADSSTEAMPSMTSPSPGMISPTETSTTSPLRSCVAGTCCTLPSTSRFAIVSVFILRRVSACALPRPSAMASAKLAKRTVNQSQSVIWAVKSAPGAWVISPLTKRTVVTALPTSTTNITGFFATLPGIEFAEGVPDRPPHDGGVEERARGMPGPLVAGALPLVGGGQARGVGGQAQESS